MLQKAGYALEARHVKSVFKDDELIDEDCYDDERELRATLDDLNQQSCLKRARATVWRLLGIVLAHKHDDGAAAKAAFTRAVLLDPRAELEANYASRESLAWYRQVRGQPPEPDVPAPAPSILTALERVGGCGSCEPQLRARAKLLIGVYSADVLDDPHAAHEAYCAAREHDPTVKADRALSAAAQNAFQRQPCDLR